MKRKRKITFWLAADKEALAKPFVLTSSVVLKTRPWTGRLSMAWVPSLSGNAQLHPPRLDSELWERGLGIYIPLNPRESLMCP